MSIHKNRVGGYDVRWRENGRSRSRSFADKLDAQKFDVKIKDAKQTGQLHRLDSGKETLDAYVEGTWAPIHVAPLAPKTQELYAGLYDMHLSPYLGSYQLSGADAGGDRPLAGGADRGGRRPDASVLKALTLLGGILQRAVEAERLASESGASGPQGEPAGSAWVRPMAPATVERICGRSEAPRSPKLVRLLCLLPGYGRKRPGRSDGATSEGGRLTVHAPKTRRHRQQPRSVRLLPPLAQDLREWRLAIGSTGRRRSGDPRA